MADTFIAVVRFGDDMNDLGDVYQDDAGLLYALWPDGANDAVLRDRHGWLWDEFGGTEYTDSDGVVRYGTRLPIVSRRRCDAVTTPTPPAAPGEE